MTSNDIEDAEALIKNSKLVICQGEISEIATKQALKIAKKHNGNYIFKIILQNIIIMLGKLCKVFDI